MFLACLSNNDNFDFDRYFYPASLAHLFVVKKMFASLHFLSLQKMCLRLLSFTDTFASLLLPLENILRCARTCLLRKNASIFIVVNCALTSIFQSRSSHGSSRVLFIFLEDYNDKIIKISWRIFSQNAPPWYYSYIL